MKVKWKSLSCVRLCDSMDCIVHGIFQSRILEWVAGPFSRGSSQPRDQTQVSHIAGGFFTSWATREAQTYYKCKLLRNLKFTVVFCQHINTVDFFFNLIVIYVTEFTIQLFWWYSWNYKADDLIDKSQMSSFIWTFQVMLGKQLKGLVERILHLGTHCLGQTS